jgi:hypothetical protein
MNDLTLTKSNEFGVVHVEGNTDPGVEFVDAWNAGTFTVIDSGRIILPPANAEALVDLAIDNGLTIENADAI